MANFLTDSRTALLARLRADATLAAAIRTWYDWGPGIIKRYSIEPAMCPVVSVVPAELTDEELSNITDRFPQDVEVGVATDGQDAEPCEAIVERVIAVVQAAGSMGLHGDGLAGVRPISVRWLAVESQNAPRVRWEALVTVRLSWYLRQLT